VMLRREFEPSFDGPEDIPVADVDAIWKNPTVHRYFDHLEVRRVAYVRALVAKNATAEEDARAHQVATDFWTAAKAARPADAKAFFDLAKGRKLDAKRDQVFPAMLDGSTDAVFAKAAFAIPGLRELGPPTRTQWGWDVQLLVEIIPERHLGRAEADA